MTDDNVLETEMPAPEGHITVKQAAAMASRHITTVYDWVHAKKVEGQWLRGKLFVEVESLKAFLAPKDAGTVRKRRKRAEMDG